MRMMGLDPQSWKVLRKIELPENVTVVDAGLEVPISSLPS